jgi:tetratricopeptide (TPR) repeat protein
MRTITGVGGIAKRYKLHYNSRHLRIPGIPMTIASQLSQLENARLVLRFAAEESTYVFKHALVQDTAYQSLLKHDRKRLHRIVGEVVEQAYPEQLDENAALLAHHFAQAGERDKAIAYARQAARRSLARYSLEEAVQQLETALALGEPDQVSESYLSLIEEAGDAHRLLRHGERALTLYQQALDLSSRWVGSAHAADAGRLTILRLHSKIIQTVVAVKNAVSLDFMRRADQMGNASLAQLETELNSLQGAPPAAEMVYALTALSLGAWRLRSAQSWDAAEKYGLAAVALAEQLSNPEILSHALDALASVYDGRGRLREHLQVALRRLALTQTIGFDNVREKIDALRGVGMAQMFLGEYGQALPPLREAESLSDEIQAVEWHAIATGLQAQCLFRLDRWDEVLELEKKWRSLEQRHSRERVGVT